MDPLRSVELTFIDAVRARRILPERSKIIAAVSGGGDSVALVRLLDRFSAHMNWELSVLHVDHGIRKDSSRDAAFVRALAEGMGLPCDVHVLKPHLSGSLEDLFSRERQRIYAESASNERLVATGHTADDRAETLIMRMMEGAGPRGLGGMDYEGVGPVRRPLLDMTRKQLREYLDSLGQEWLADPTNREDDFLRNRIRHIILPACLKYLPHCFRQIVSINIGQRLGQRTCCHLYVNPAHLAQGFKHVILLVNTKSFC